MRLCVVLLACACGSSGVSRAVVSGKVQGTQVNVNNAGAIVVKTSGTPTVAVILSNAADGCSGSAANLKNQQYVQLGVTGLTGAAIATGTYPVYDQESGNIPNGTVVFAEYHSTNAACHDATPPNHTRASGKVDVHAVI